MKKFFFQFVIVVFICIFSGCNSYGNHVTIGRDIGYEVIRCINEKDIETLKGFFCSEVILGHDIENELNKMMSCINGNIVSFDKTFFVGGGVEVLDGEITTESVCPYITKIITDVGQQLEISCFAYVVNEKNPNRIGITRITIFYDNGKSCVVGEIF